MYSALATRAFWIAAAERAIKTFAQALLSTLGVAAGTSAVPELGLHDVAWLGAISVAALAAVLSVLTSISTAGDVVGTDPRRGVEG